jgi:hypothetical protein
MRPAAMGSSLFAKLDGWAQGRRLRLDRCRSNWRCLRIDMHQRCA